MIENPMLVGKLVATIHTEKPDFTFTLFIFLLARTMEILFRIDSNRHQKVEKSHLSNV